MGPTVRAVRESRANPGKPFETLNLAPNPTLKTLHPRLLVGGILEEAAGAA